MGTTTLAEQPAALTMIGARVYDQFDVTLEDRELLIEVELTTNLIIAASESDQKLSQAEVDRILGIEPLAEPVPPSPATEPLVEGQLAAPPTPRSPDTP